MLVGMLILLQVEDEADEYPEVRMSNVSMNISLTRTISHIICNFEKAT